METGFSDKWKILSKNLAYPYEYFNSPDDYQKPVNNLRKADFFSKLKNDDPSDKELERTKETIKKFNIKNGGELTQIFLKSDVFLLTCVFEKFIKGQLTKLVIIHFIVLVYLVILGNVV